MHQLGLFDAPPLARSCDPLTSTTAAAEIAPQLVGCRLVALEAARYVVRQYGDATANEIAVRAASMSCRPAETFRKRVHELVRLGRLIVAGERKCSTTGRMARTFRVKD